MKKLLYPIAFTLTAFLFVYSCSAEEDTSPPPSIVITPKPEPEPPAPTQYTLTVTAGEGGTVSSSGGTYDEGTSVTITATPNEGYEFVGWTGAIESSELVIQILVSEAKEVNAGFSFICLTTELENYFLPSYYTFKIIHPKDINQVNENPTHYYDRYGSEKISLDYNKDGFMDFVAFENDYNTENNRQLIKFYLGDCEGNLTLDELNSNKFEGLVHGRKILLGDYNNDTYPDVFLIGHGWDKPPFPGEYPVILFSSESGVFTEKRLTQFDGFFHGGSSGDFDNDGDLDVIMNTNQMYKFGSIYLENDGYGNFTENENLGPLSKTHSEESDKNFFQNYFNSEMYDINKDGYLDILFMTAEEGEKNFDWMIPSKIQYTNTILYGNGSDFTGEVISLPTVEGWPEVYDVEFFDLDGNGTEEIIFNRNKFRDTFKSWYIQILEKVGDKYIDNTYKYIDINENVSGIEKYHTWLEIRDYDNDGIIEMRNSTPKQVEEHNQLYMPNNELFYSEWELINGKLMKVD